MSRVFLVSHKTTASFLPPLTRLLKKRVLITANVALFVYANLSATTLAEPANTPNEAAMNRPRFSARDFAAFSDVRIAALKSGLQLKPVQEQKWFGLETVLREEALRHAERAAESLEKAEEPHDRHDVIENLRERAKQLEANAVELENLAVEFKKLADAAQPLYESLDNSQKRLFEPLLRKHVGLPGRHY